MLIIIRGRCRLLKALSQLALSVQSTIGALTAPETLVLVAKHPINYPRAARYAVRTEKIT